MVRLNQLLSEASGAVLHLMLWSDLEKLGRLVDEALTGVAQGVSLLKGAGFGRLGEVGR